MRQTKFLPVKGTRDFYPPQMAFRNWLFAKMREVSQRFGYQEYEGPILEPLDLYAVKSGEELVREQTFILTDRGGRKLALRPELTPTLARMVAQKQKELTFPLRWFSLGPRFRYEQPQKGRLREFYQWDVDLIGPKTPEADAEVITLACEFFKTQGLTPKEVVIKINDRRFADFKLTLVEIPKKKIPEIFRAIDKKEKMPPDQWEGYLSNLGLSPLQIKDLKLLLVEKDFSESEELVCLFSTLKDLGVGDFCRFDPTVVRGLDYYTGTVFEAWDQKGEFRAILGGGRYDNLVKVLGGQPLPGVGFALGEAVLEEVLKKFGKIPKLSPTVTQVLVTVFDESFYRDSLKLATKLQSLGNNVEIYPDPQAKLDKQLKYADQKGIPYVVILGPDELAKGVVTLKNMQTGEQKQVAPAKTDLQKQVQKQVAPVSLPDELK